MKHYIKKELIKELNNKFFRANTGIKNSPFPVSSTPDIGQIEHFIKNSDCNKPENLYRIILDLQSIADNKTPLMLVSDKARQLQKTCEKLEENILESFRQNPFPEVREVADILETLSKEAYLVGGCIRDMCIGEIPNDFDFCTDTDIGTLEKVFTNKGYKVDSVGKAFLVLVVSKNGETFEIANFRKDRNNAGGEIGNIYEDAQRRDFTINAGYFSLNLHTIVDPNGQFFEDIQTKTLKFIGKPIDRLIEDPLRSLRFYRFISRGYTPDKKSLRAVRENFEDSVRNTSAERIRTEIEKIIHI